MEELSNAGNGNYFYLDDYDEAKRIFQTDITETLLTIAKDVKVQVEFNPSAVKAYRLIGYENRMLEDKDFNDDTKDAGELNAQHSVTAIYEIIPTGTDSKFAPDVDALKYGMGGNSDELMTIKLRYKKPDSEKSVLMTHPVKNSDKSWKEASENFRFASAVTEFGLLLKHSQFRNEANFEQVLQLAQSAKGKDEKGYREEFIELVKQTKILMKRHENSFQ